MNTRSIPKTGEPLPVIGCGTYLGFDQPRSTPEYARLPGVLEALFTNGGSVLDSSPMYGRAEQSTGELLDAGNWRGQAFIATKVWIQGGGEGVRQMENSRRLLGTKRVDLMQIHNLLDWREHLATLRDWKRAGRIRYVGISHYTASAYAEVEAVLASEELDFLQINYSAAAREAERRVLPLAQERGVAVLVNMPFRDGGMLQKLSRRPLPAWTAEIGCTSWAQVLLKFVLSHPAVTCVIPGSSRGEHMAANALAGTGLDVGRAFWKDKLADFST